MPFLYTNLNQADTKLKPHQWFDQLLIKWLVVGYLSLASVAQATLAIPPLTGINAKSYILMDYASQTILAAENAQQRLEPASLTKVMTAYVALKERQLGEFDNSLTISEKAYRMIGSRSFLEINDRVDFNTVLRGLMVQSGNDAAVAIAEHIAGDESTFVDRMNAYAEQMGLQNTHFVNSTGLPNPEHYSSAQDLATITAHFIREFPDLYSIYSMKSFEYNGIKQRNRNRLLWRDPAVDGVKTGHTESAGYCLIASAKKNNTRLISVVMGSTSDQQRMLQSQKSLNYGFRYFVTKTLLLGNQTLETSQIWFGNQELLDVGIATDWQAAIPKRFEDDLEIRYDYPQHDLQAPISKGQVIGKALLVIDNEVIDQIDLISLEEVTEAGLFKRFSDWIKRLFNSVSQLLFG